MSSGPASYLICITDGKYSRQFRERGERPDVARIGLTISDIMMTRLTSGSTPGSAREAIVMIRGEDGSALTVVFEGRPVGALTDRGEATGAANAPDPADLPVSDAPSRGVRSIRPDDPLDVIKEKFGDPEVRRLLVIDSCNQMLGIIAHADYVPQLPEADVGESLAGLVGRAPSLEKKRGGLW
jgi:predicted transcriptional regulator